MSLEKVKEEILENARKKASEIISEGREEAKKIAREAEIKIKKIEEEIKKSTEKLAETMEKRELSSSEFESKKQLLDKKKKKIDHIFEEVAKEIAKLPAASRKKHISNLIEKGKGNIEVGHVYCNKKDIAAVEQLKAFSREISGGVILENKEKNVSIDYSYETLISQIRERYLQEIAKILFGK